MSGRRTGWPAIIESKPLNNSDLYATNMDALLQAAAEYPEQFIPTHLENERIGGVMSGYRPDENNIRLAWQLACLDHEGMPESGAKFDDWLQQVRAKTWEEGCRAAWRSVSRKWPDIYPTADRVLADNPYDDAPGTPRRRLDETSRSEPDADRELIERIAVRLFGFDMDGLTELAAQAPPFKAGVSRPFLIRYVGFARIVSLWSVALRLRLRRSSCSSIGTGAFFSERGTLPVGICLSVL